MKKFFTALALTLLLPVAASAANWQEGKHYTVIQGQPTKTKEVREYFSFYCPACRGFEAFLPDIKESLPKGVKFKKTHVDFMGHTDQETQFMITKAFLVAEKSKLGDAFSTAMFNYLQTERKQVKSLDDLKAIYVNVGGDAAKFDKGFKNFMVVKTAEKDKKVQDRLSKARHVKSVPTFVVNGKYAINSSALSRDNFVEEYKALINYLAQK